VEANQATTQDNAATPVEAMLAPPAEFVREITGPESFGAPFGVAVGPQGNLYVTDSQRNAVDIFDHEGDYLSTIGGPGDADGEFSFIDKSIYVATDTEGNVYVADAGNNRIQKFTADGMFLDAWGSFGQDDGQFLNDFGVATDDSGNVYVAD